jgi:hypothetical protein
LNNKITGESPTDNSLKESINESNKQDINLKTTTKNNFSEQNINLLNNYNPNKYSADDYLKNINENTNISVSILNQDKNKNKSSMVDEYEIGPSLIKDNYKMINSENFSSSIYDVKNSEINNNYNNNYDFTKNQNYNDNNYNNYNENINYSNNYNKNKDIFSDINSEADIDNFEKHVYGKEKNYFASSIIIDDENKKEFKETPDNVNGNDLDDDFDRD